MKQKRSYLFLIFILVLVSSCKKDEFQYGKATALNNGAVWEAQATRGAIINKPHEIGYDFIFEVYKGDFLWQVMHLAKIPDRVGNYALTNSSPQVQDDLTFALFYTVLPEGDVVEDAYRVQEDSTLSYINISEINKSWIEGTFEGVFYLDPNRPVTNPNNPDTILFKQGEFRIKIN